MRYLTAACLAIGAAAIVGLGAAQAKPQQQQVHVMTVQLPFGGVETIGYVGNTPPVVKWSRVDPLAAFDASFGFADFDRIAAAMNRQMAELDRQMARLERDAARAQADGVYNASAGAANGGFCAETVEMTQRGEAAPHIVRHSYGACAPSHSVAPTESSAGQRV